MMWNVQKRCSFFESHKLCKTYYHWVLFAQVALFLNLLPKTILEKYSPLFRIFIAKWWAGHEFDYFKKADFWLLTSTNIIQLTWNFQRSYLLMTFKRLIRIMIVARFCTCGTPLKTFFLTSQQKSDPIFHWFCCSNLGQCLN